MKMRKFFLTTALALSAGASLNFSGPAMADFDVSPAVASGKIVTNAFADATGETIGNVRVFGFEFGEDPLDPFFLEDPGFHPLPGTGVPGNTPFSAKSFSPLSYWTGSAFGALPADETLVVTRGSTTITLGNTGDPGPVVIETTDSDGEFDEHLNSTLDGAGSADPSAGIYLYSLTLSAPGLIDSDTVYLLFNNEASEEQFSAAQLYARDTFAPGSTLVPEPSGLAMLALSACLLKRRRPLAIA